MIDTRLQLYLPMNCKLCKNRAGKLSLIEVAIMAQVWFLWIKNDLRLVVWMMSSDQIQGNSSNSYNTLSGTSDLESSRIGVGPKVGRHEGFLRLRHCMLCKLFGLARSIALLPGKIAHELGCGKRIADQRICCHHAA